ncbi:MAG: PIN domain-containing protein [Flavobacteriales bacterium]|nr:PIN domain-containing protein [Flavobacteriales bacterium]
MKRYFIDANIMLDALLQREGHDPQEAVRLLAMGEKRQVRLFTTSNSMGVVLYHLQRSDADKKGLRLRNAQRIIIDLLACVEVVPVDAEHFRQSAASTFGDIEDGAQYFAVAAVSALDGVVSRDPDYDGHIGTKRITAAQALRAVK